MESMKLSLATNVNNSQYVLTKSQKPFHNVLFVVVTQIHGIFKVIQDDVQMT